MANAVTAALPAIALHFLTGVTLTGVYPPGMKILAGWFDDRRGFAIGILVGSLIVGSALPHLIRAVGGVGRPDVVLYGAAALATVGGMLILLVRPGPHQAPAAPFDPGAIGRLLGDRETMLANVGYVGHMWELYAAWTWIPAYLVASMAATGGSGEPSGLASLLAFGTIAIGGIGAVVGGPAADRFGRTGVTSASMVVSGIGCLAAGVLFGSSLALLVPFVLLWGFVVADSAQFSGAVTELADESSVGTPSRCRRRSASCSRPSRSS